MLHKTSYIQSHNKLARKAVQMGVEKVSFFGHCLDCEKEIVIVNQDTPWGRQESKPYCKECWNKRKLETTNLIDEIDSWDEEDDREDDFEESVTPEQHGADLNTPPER